MRRISLLVCLAVGALGVLPDTAEAQLFRRRRARYDCCCMPVQPCCGGGYYGGPAYASSPCCGPVYGGPAYGGPVTAGYFPEGGPYTAGYPGFAGGQPMPTPSLNVNIRDGAFEPNRINIRQGESVRWTNNGTKVHTVTADDGAWDSGNLDPGKSFTRKFEKAGTFNYHCEPHKDQMKASVVVAPGDGSAVPPPPVRPGERLPNEIDK